MSGDGRIAVVAGSGDLPLELIRQLAGGDGHDLFVAAMLGAADPEVATGEWETAWFEVHRLGDLVAGIKEAGVDRLVLAGKVRHETIIAGGGFDGVLRDMMASLPDHQGGTLLAGVVALLGDAGITVLPVTEVAPQLSAAKGLLAGPEPGESLMGEINFGWPIAKGVAAMGIGQSVIVRGRSVVAVEAMEGTDDAIGRGGRLLGCSGQTLIKVAAPGHDMRYDIPTMGVETVTALARAGGGAIVVEAGGCLILGRDEVRALCRREGITLLAVDGAPVEDGA